MTSERVAYVNGHIVPESEAVVSIRDRGFLSGDAVFDTTRTFGGRIFRLDEHLDRFFNSLKYMRIDPGLTKDDFARLTMEVLRANVPLLDDDDDYWVSQRVSRGVRVDGVDRQTVVIECAPLPFKARARYYRDVCRCRSVGATNAARVAESEGQGSQLRQSGPGRVGSQVAEPRRLADSARHQRQPRGGAWVQYLHRQGRRRRDPEGAVRSCRHQPPRDDPSWRRSSASKSTRRTSTSSTPTPPTRHSSPPPASASARCLRSTGRPSLTARFRGL